MHWALALGSDVETVILRSSPGTMACPIPRPPPVTTAVRLFSDFASIICAACLATGDFKVLFRKAGNGGPFEHQMRPGCDAICLI